MFLQKGFLSLEFEVKSRVDRIIALLKSKIRVPKPNIPIAQEKPLHFAK